MDSLSELLGQLAEASAGSEDELSSRFQHLVAELRRRSEFSPHYSVLESIDRGGMGAIRRVRDDEFERALAMKVVLQRETSPGSKISQMDSRALVRFLDEAQITAQLNHPGIVAMHDLGIDQEDRVYYTTALIEGSDLSSIIQSEKGQDEDWRQGPALWIVLRVCETMAYAHSQGVVHRDLKPANIMTGRFGQVFVIDWGLAKAQGRKDTRDIRLQSTARASPASVQTLLRKEREETPGSPLVTMDGDVAGTPSYMSPEQARGDIEGIGPRSDVYSVGAILYHILTGQSPYVPPNARVSVHTILKWVLEGPPQPVRAINPNTPRKLEAICARAMRRDPAERYSDMGELAEDLRAHLEKRNLLAISAEPADRSNRWIERIVAFGGLGRLHRKRHKPFRSLEASLAGSPNKGFSVEAEPSSVSLSDRIRTLLETLELRSTRCSRYEVQEEIGMSGIATMRRAKDTLLERDVAIITLPVATDVALRAEAADSITRFLNGALVAGQLDHPGIVPIHEVGMDVEGNLYFTTQRVQGVDLSEVLGLVRRKDEGWSLTRALGVILRACEAVAYAHSRGVVHRNLKPTNVMVGQFGQVYVLDWELALTEQIATWETAGSIVGTPPYMAPEQARGQLNQVGARTDVYSMGALLYHFIVGKAPYLLEHEIWSPKEVWQAVVEGPPTPVSQIKVSVPRRLCAICEKAMAREPAHRYSDMVEMASELRVFLEG